MPTWQVVCESCRRHSTCRVVSAVSIEELQRVCNNPYQLLNMSGDWRWSLQTPTLKYVKLHIYSYCIRYMMEYRGAKLAVILGSVSKYSSCNFTSPLWRHNVMFNRTYGQFQLYFTLLSASCVTDYLILMSLWYQAISIPSRLPILQLSANHLFIPLFKIFSYFQSRTARLAIWTH